MSIKSRLYWINWYFGDRPPQPIVLTHTGWWCGVIPIVPGCRCTWSDWLAVVINYNICELCAQTAAASSSQVEGERERERRLYTVCLSVGLPACLPAYSWSDCEGWWWWYIVAGVECAPSQWLHQARTDWTILLARDPRLISVELVGCDLTCDIPYRTRSARSSAPILKGNIIYSGLFEKKSAVIRSSAPPRKWVSEEWWRTNE